jgi:hypothetical protein
MKTLTWASDVETGRCIGMFQSYEGELQMAKIIRSKDGAVVFRWAPDIRPATFMEFLFNHDRRFGMMDSIMALLTYYALGGIAVYCTFTSSEFDPAWSRWGVIAFVLSIALFVIPYMQWRNFKRKTV